MINEELKKLIEEAISYLDLKNDFKPKNLKKLKETFSKILEIYGPLDKHGNYESSEDHVINFRLRSIRRLIEEAEKEDE